MESEAVWTAVRWSGIEHITCAGADDGWRVDSASVLVLDGRAVRVAYQLRYDTSWRPRHVAVEVHGRDRPQRLELESDGRGCWRGTDGRRYPDLDGCIDVDLSSTPLTNTPPIRRVGPEAGAAAQIACTYVTVPDLNVRQVSQRYTCLDAGSNGGIYRYEASSFLADLTVDAGGLVIDYPGVWSRIALEPSRNGGGSVRA